MKKKLLVSLLGGRATPNINYYLQLKPDVFIVIASKDSFKAPRGSAYLLLNKVPKNLAPSEIIEVEPYSMNDTAEKLNVIYENHKDAYDIIIQSASEPKIMGFSALLWAQRQAANIKFVSSTTNGYMDILGLGMEATALEPIKISDYCSLYGWKEVSYQQNKDTYNPIIEYISTNLQKFTLLFKHCMSLSNNNENYDFHLNQFSENEKEILKSEAVGMQILLKPNNTFCYKTKFLISGDWLEYYVYNAAAKSKKFDDVAWNVKTSEGGWEIDVLCVSQGTPILISCKTYTDAKKITQPLYHELNARASNLGRDVCQLFLVTLVSYNDIDSLRKQVIDRYESDYGVKTIFLEDLLDRDKLFDTIDKKMYQ